MRRTWTRRIWMRRMKRRMRRKMRRVCVLLLLSSSTHPIHSSISPSPILNLLVLEALLRT